MEPLTKEVSTGLSQPLPHPLCRRLLPSLLSLSMLLSPTHTCHPLDATPSLSSPSSFLPSLLLLLATTEASREDTHSLPHPVGSSISSFLLLLETIPRAHAVGIALPLGVTAGEGQNGETGAI